MAYVPGSLVFTHRTGPVSRLIAWGQKLRFRGNDRRYAHWSHVAMIVSKEGHIVEALGHGVERNHISKYTNTDYRVHTIWMADSLERDRVVRFAMHAIGRKYGFLEILSLGTYLLSGSKLRFGLDNQLICSGLASEALSRTDAIFPHEPMYMMPADLAKFYGVA